MHTVFGASGRLTAALIDSWRCVCVFNRDREGEMVAGMHGA